MLKSAEVRKPGSMAKRNTATLPRTAMSDTYRLTRREADKQYRPKGFVS